MHSSDFRSPVSAFALFALLPTISAPAWAGNSEFLVSTASSASLPSGQNVDDASWVRVGAGASALAFSEGHWLGMAGTVPGDIDALTTRPGFAPGHHAGYVFSFLSNESGMLDGDAIGFASGGGFEVVVAEDEFASALGLPGEGLDIDALAYDSQGRLCFSLQADLDGTALGLVEDGDVLRLEGNGTATRVIAEFEVQDRFTQAIGQTGAIGDVLGATFVAGELWVSTQGPSDFDGSLLSTGASPAIELTEADLQLGGAELSALAKAPVTGDAGRMWTAETSVAKGDILTARYTGGTPFGTIAVFPAGTVGYAPVVDYPGIGAWYFDLADPVLNQALSGPLPVMQLDAAGELTSDLLVPGVDPGGPGWNGDLGWTFQCVDLTTLTLAAPYRIRVTG